MKKIRIAGPPGTGKTLTASVLGKALNHPVSKAWVEKFVRCYGFTGQIAFDFIETDSDEIFAIECNPRAISGVHLFDEGLVSAIVDKTTISPVWGKQVSVWLAVLCYGWQSTPLKRWLQTLIQSRDVIFSRTDLMPFLAQFGMLWHVMRICREQKCSLIEGTTYDIEWNHGDIS